MYHFSLSGNIDKRQSQLLLVAILLVFVTTYTILLLLSDNLCLPFDKM